MILKNKLQKINTILFYVIIENIELRLYYAFFPAGKWPDPESNWGHKDFQSSALPTELSGLI